MRWLVGERPQVASIFHHGKLLSFTDNAAHIEFDAKLYADMVQEADSKQLIDTLMMNFFKRPIILRITSTSGESTGPTRADRRQKATKEVLESDIVKKAAEIFDAKIHDVKTKV